MLILSININMKFTFTFILKPKSHKNVIQSKMFYNDYYYILQPRRSQRVKWRIRERAGAVV